MSLTRTARLRKALGGERAIMAPGVVDAMYARLVAEAGFDAMYMTGAGTSATRLGYPDVGLLTMTEMVDNATRIADASDVPLIADADNGYGGPLNVRRAIQQYERGGIAAVHLEDQVLPKRCGHLAGKQLISAADMVAKVKAAVDARIDPDFVVIARTDALALHGRNAAFDRAEMYREAGADVIFVESPLAEDLPHIAPRFPGVPLLYNMATSGKTPFLTRSEIEKLGFKLIIYPNWLLLSACEAARKTLEVMKNEESIASVAPQVMSFRQFFDTARMAEVQELEARYGTPEESRTGY
ncbi:2-methylisocitrate lyase-like PEP mutase family enzyme [Defluviimonas denitrificans]|jgi:2-methylisocitrate lyase-like PEP mutase family enzyme|uniref:2-methylisocitrate lyase n=1 Tax=Albidovulum denitrificans TaxID=404881 RepID=A0A2S8SBP0_9RHOB|nr:isocitrate lyase/PEP mutase family protein [Defluviimonas denitrificans]MCB1408370.1 isocitrate lyase/PEP mutase family protein [Paracoccaceae bacterium]PQV58206.1 2-methylisocitrate lyase-like PEP mutase family enzyme [Defluviimonas denitrificans]